MSNINNTKYGVGSLKNNKGKDNSAFGAYNSYKQTNATNNTGVGSNAAFYNQTGINNTAVGAGSLCNNLDGNLNTAVGSSALEGIVDDSVGNRNVAVGVQALYSSSSSDNNTAVGSYALLNNSNGSNNTALGFNSMFNNNGNQNTALGTSALSQNIIGGLNTALGLNAGFNMYDGSFNTFLGANTGVDSSLNTYSYSTAIGYGAIITGSNQIVIGGSGPNGYPEVIIPGPVVISDLIISGNLTVDGLISASGGITGSTGSFENIIISDSLTVDGLISASGGITGSTGSFENIIISDSLTVDGLISAPGGITGSTGSFENIVVSDSLTVDGLISAPGGITGSTGSFENVVISGSFTVDGLISAPGGITGSTGSFENIIISDSLTVDGLISASGGITGSTGSFENVVISDSLTVNGLISAPGGIIGSTGSFQNVWIANDLDVSGNIVVDPSGSVTAYSMFLTGPVLAAPNSVVPKSYVDSISAGLNAKGACGCAAYNDATTITGPSGTISVYGGPWLASNPYIIDGQVTTGSTGGTDLNRVLINNQGGSNPSIDNGIWVVTPTGTNYSMWKRSKDMLDGSNAQGAYTLVKYGIENGKSSFVQYNGFTGPAIVGSTGLNFIEYNTLDYELGRGLSLSGSISGENYINVDTSLNFINYLDSTITTGVNAGGDGILNIGNYTDTAINIGPSGSFNNTINIGTNGGTINIGRTITNANYVNFLSGITGPTGSFQYVTGGTGSFNNLYVSGLITARGGITGATGSFQYVTGGTGSFNNLFVSGLITAPGGITGATGSFQYVTGGTGSFNNLFVSGLITAPGGITGATGSFQYVTGGTGSFNNLFVSGLITARGGITGATGSFQYVTGGTGSFNNLFVSGLITAPGGITGATGSFQYVTGGTGSFNNLFVSGLITAPGGITGSTGSFQYVTGGTGSFNNLFVSGLITARGGITGATGSFQYVTGGTGSFNNLFVSGLITAPGGITGATGSFQYVTGGTGSFNNLFVSGLITARGGITGATGSFQYVTGGTGSFNNLFVSGLITAPGGITGATGSFQYVTGGTGSFNNLYVSGLITARGGITGATGSFQYVTGGTGSFNNLFVSGLITAPGGITGATGSFQYVTGGTGSFNNLFVSGLITAPGGITGATGSFQYVTGGTGSFTTLNVSGLITAPGGITGATGSFQYVTGGTGSFNNLFVSGLITARGGITGATGSFQYVTGGTGSFQYLRGGTGSFTTLNVSGLITAPGGITTTALTATDLISASGGITGAAGSFATLNVSGLITAPGGILGTTGTFQNISVNNNLDVSGNVDVGPSGSVTAYSMFLSTGAVQPEDNSVVPKSYVDAVSAGLSVRGPCGCAAFEGTTITGPSGTISVYGGPWLSSNPYIIDGQTTTGDTGGTNLNRVLINNQGTSPSIDNGIWVVTPTGTNYSIWQRSFDMAEGSNAQAAYLLVKYGTENGQSSYVQYNGYSGEAIVGATGLNFIKFTSFGYVLGRGLDIEGGTTNTINVDTSLNFINYLDSTYIPENVNAGGVGTLNIGNYTTNAINIGPISNNNYPINIGPSGGTINIGNTITNPNYVNFLSGINGPTGSFTYVNASGLITASSGITSNDTITIDNGILNINTSVGGGTNSISLNSGGYGFGVTGSTVKYLSAGGNHNFYGVGSSSTVDGTLMAQITSSGLDVSGNITATSNISGGSFTTDATISMTSTDTSVGPNRISLYPTATASYGFGIASNTLKYLSEGGYHNFYCNGSSSSDGNLAMQIQSNGVTITQNSTSGGDPVFAVSGSSNSILFNINSGTGAYNGIVQFGDSAIFAGGATIGSGVLCLTTHSNSAVGMRITGTTVAIDGATTFNSTVTAPTFSGNATSATNLANGSAGNIPYQSAAGTTLFVSNGTQNQVLTCNVNSAPSWTTPSAITDYVSTTKQTIQQIDSQFVINAPTSIVNGYTALQIPYPSVGTVGPNAISLYYNQTYGFGINSGILKYLSAQQHVFYIGGNPQDPSGNDGYAAMYLNVDGSGNGLMVVGGQITTNVFNGYLNGTAGYATNATNAGNVTGGTSGYVLTTDGNNGSSWTNTINLGGGSSVTATTFFGSLTGDVSGNVTGTASDLSISGPGVVYQTAANNTTYIGNGTSTQVLTSNGASSVPTWQTIPEVSDVVFTDVSSNQTIISPFTINAPVQTSLVPTLKIYTSGSTYYVAGPNAISLNGPDNLYGFGVNGAGVTYTTYTYHKFYETQYSTGALPGNQIAIMNINGFEVNGNITTKATTTIGAPTAGNITAAGSVTATSFNATSDYRIKQDIQILNDTHTVDKLRPVSYYNTLTKKPDIGLVAHELQDVYPFMVTGDKDGKENQSVNYLALIGILIKEIQELKERVHILENK